MQIGLILSHRYPKAVSLEDYEVREDTEGDQWIASWDEAKLGTQPTTEQLRSWWLDAEKWSQRARFRLACDAEYEAVLAPEGNLTLLQRDEILEKRAIRGAGGIVNLRAGEQAASDRIDALRAKRAERFAAVGAVTQGASETVEDAVTRVRAVAW